RLPRLVARAAQAGPGHLRPLSGGARRRLPPLASFLTCLLRVVSARPTPAAAAEWRRALLPRVPGESR
ncbi:hypothetical protein ACNF5F_26295, partial [Escherichia coli]